MMRIVALALAPDRGVAVEGDDHADSECRRLRQIGNMATMQDVETTIGEHQRARQFGGCCGQLLRRADF